MMMLGSHGNTGNVSGQKPQKQQQQWCASRFRRQAGIKQLIHLLVMLASLATPSSTGTSTVSVKQQQQHEGVKGHTEATPHAQNDTHS